MVKGVLWLCASGQIMAWDWRSTTRVTIGAPVNSPPLPSQCRVWSVPHFLFSRGSLRGLLSLRICAIDTLHCIYSALYTNHDRFILSHPPHRTHCLTSQLIMAEPKLIHKWSEGEASVVRRKIARSKRQKAQQPFLDWILRNQIRTFSLVSPLPPPSSVLVFDPAG
jgi:hypothetical protein